MASANKSEEIKQSQFDRKKIQKECSNEERSLKGSYDKDNSCVEPTQELNTTNTQTLQKYEIKQYQYYDRKSESGEGDRIKYIENEILTLSEEIKPFLSDTDETSIFSDSDSYSEENEVVCLPKSSKPLLSEETVLNLSKPALIKKNRDEFCINIGQILKPVKEEINCSVKNQCLPAEIKNRSHNKSFGAERTSLTNNFLPTSNYKTLLMPSDECIKSELESDHFDQSENELNTKRKTVIYVPRKQKSLKENIIPLESNTVGHSSFAKLTMESPENTNNSSTNGSKRNARQTETNVIPVDEYNLGYYEAKREIGHLPKRFLSTLLKRIKSDKIREQTGTNVFKGTFYYYPKYFTPKSKKKSKKKCKGQQRKCTLFVDGNNKQSVETE